MGVWFISRHRTDAFSMAGLLMGHENQQVRKIPTDIQIMFVSN
jgi:hypothetical protein